MLSLSAHAGAQGAGSHGVPFMSAQLGGMGGGVGPVPFMSPLSPPGYGTGATPALRKHMRVPGAPALSVKAAQPAAAASQHSAAHSSAVESVDEAGWPGRSTPSKLTSGQAP